MSKEKWIWKIFLSFSVKSNSHQHVERQEWLVRSGCGSVGTVVTSDARMKIKKRGREWPILKEWFLPLQKVRLSTKVREGKEHELHLFRYDTWEGDAIVQSSGCSLRLQFGVMLEIFRILNLNRRKHKHFHSFHALKTQLPRIYYQRFLTGHVSLYRWPLVSPVKIHPNRSAVQWYYACKWLFSAVIHHNNQLLLKTILV